jgi:CxxC-x17-CxxC domain-containing protein
MTRSKHVEHSPGNFCAKCVIAQQGKHKVFKAMSFQNKDLTCRDCDKTFVFSAGEQEFFAQKGLINEPKRCPNCRILMRVQRNGYDPSRTAEVNCAECGCPTRVPFQPKGYRPVYCSACFRTKRAEAQSGTDTAVVDAQIAAV